MLSVNAEKQSVTYSYLSVASRLSFSLSDEPQLLVVSVQLGQQLRIDGQLSVSLDKSHLEQQ